MAEDALVIEQLTVYYDRVRALEDVSLQVRTGQVVALLGANGAGKSSTLRAVSGIVPKRGGRVRAFGVDITDQRPEAIVAHGVAHVPEGREVFTSMTARENLILGATARRGRKSFDDVYELFPLLADREAQMAGTLSGGEQQMLAIGRALMSDPQLLLLDEPSMGLAPIVIAEVKERLRVIAEGGVSILLVEQNASFALDLADYAYVLATGTLKTHGRPADLVDSGALASAYLGG